MVQSKQEALAAGRPTLHRGFPGDARREVALELEQERAVMEVRVERRILSPTVAVRVLVLTCVMLVSSWTGPAQCQTERTETVDLVGLSMEDQPYVQGPKIDTRTSFWVMHESVALTEHGSVRP